MKRGVDQERSTPSPGLRRETWDRICKLYGWHILGIGYYLLARYA